MDYWLKKPGGSRKTFTVMRRPLRGKGAKAHKVEDSRIDLINKHYVAGTLDFVGCEKQLKALIEELRGKEEPGAESLAANDQAFHAALAKFNKRKNTKDQSKLSAKNGLKRGINALGHLSLFESPISAIQEHIDELPETKQRDRAKWINILLHHVGREERLELTRDTRTGVNYLTPEQLERTVPHLPDDAWKALVWVAFGTGGRFGELFAIDFMNKGLVTIAVQRTAEWKEVETKNRKSRTCPIIPDALSWLPKWFDVPLETKMKMRREYKGAEVVRNACNAAGVTSCTFHELRHSYAIFWRKSGESVANIAQFIGDTEDVCRKHYLRFGADDAVAEAAIARLAQKKAG